MQTEVVLVNPRRKYRRSNPGLPSLPTPRALIGQFDWRAMISGMFGAVVTGAVPKLLSKPLGKFTKGWFGIAWSGLTALVGGYFLKKWNQKMGQGFLFGGLILTGLRALRQILPAKAKGYVSTNGVGDEFLFGNVGAMSETDDIELFGDYNEDEEYFGSFSPSEAGDRTIVGIADQAFEGAFGEIDALDDNLIPTFTGY
jgi:hypothetical protein